MHPEDRALRDPRSSRRSQTRDVTRWSSGSCAGWNFALDSGAGALPRRAEGAVSRLLGVSVDVTKRKEAEDLFHLATEASPSGTLLVDGKGRIRLVNAHIEELFGYHREELLDQPDRSAGPESFMDRAPRSARAHSGRSRRARGAHRVGAVWRGGRMGANSPSRWG